MAFINRSTKLVERYVVSAVVPYFLLALSLLTAVLLTQQGTRFAEILSTTRAPLWLIAQIISNLIPNVLLFTIPMAVLAGTIIGFGRLASDSELIAMRAAGVGTIRLLSPLLLIGFLLSLLSLFIGFLYVPSAANSLRDTTMRAMQRKLESPVQPGVFTTDIPGKVIYVREGDEQTGEWGKVFIYSQEADGRTLLVTARSGRIDSSGGTSELVLRDAVVSNLLISPDAMRNQRQVVTESSSGMRVRLDTGIETLLQRLRTREPEADELGWSELLGLIGEGNLERGRSAKLALHKRLALCVAPFCFALFGASLGLRVRRGGRGLGVLLSIAAVLVYYLLALGGEQFSRTGVLPIPVGVWFASLASVVVSTLLIFLPNGNDGNKRFYARSKPKSIIEGHLYSNETSEQSLYTPQTVTRVGTRFKFTTFNTLLNRTILRSLIINFVVTVCALSSIFVIFTLFELAMPIITHQTSWYVVSLYFANLLPFIYVSLAALALLISVLITYALSARRSEVVAWFAAGESVYKVAIPGVIFALAISVSVWFIQESVAPSTNQRQDALRNQIRTGVLRGSNSQSRQWLVSEDGRRIYSYQLREGQQILDSPLIFFFSNERVYINKIVSASSARIDTKNPSSPESQEKQLLLSDSATFSFAESSVSPLIKREGVGVIALDIKDDTEALVPTLKKPAHMNYGQLKKYISSIPHTRADQPLNALIVAAEFKQANAIAPLVMSLIGIPLALAFGRRSAVVALCAAVATGLSFWGVTGGFNLLGNHGLLPTTIAVWSPPAIFAMTGIYLLGQAKT